jgi:hypothetical protein
MTSQDLNKLKADKDGLHIYEYLANNIEEGADDINTLIDMLSEVDLSGQYMASAARYLNAIDSEKFGEQVKRLVALTIDRDREHNFLGQLMTSLYGEDYADHAKELSATDNNFRRMYKRLYPTSVI